jgi:hydrogenase/urease accessory protein HupE
MLWFSSQNQVCSLIIQPLGSSFALGFPTRSRALPIWSTCVGRLAFAVQDALARRAGGSTKAIGLVLCVRERSLCHLELLLQECQD